LTKSPSALFLIGPEGDYKRLRTSGFFIRGIGLLTYFFMNYILLQIGAPSLLEKEPEIDVNKMLCICRCQKTS